jgi:hypothetical protein
MMPGLNAAVRTLHPRHASPCESDGFARGWPHSLLEIRPPDLAQHGRAAGLVTEVTPDCRGHRGLESGDRTLGIVSRRD